MKPNRTLLGAVFTTALATLAPLLVACGSDDDQSDNAAPSPEPYPGCEDQFFGACHYWEAECQERVFDAVRCIGGSAAAEIPPVVEITKSELVAQLTAEVESDTSDPTVDAAYQRAMVLIGLAEDGQLDVQESVEAYVETAPAFYSSDTGTVTLITGDDGSHGSDDYANTMYLAHEFVHAIQDQEHDLGSMQEARATTFDGYLATLSAIEGEATLVELFYDIAYNGYRLEELNIRAVFEAWASDSEAALQGMSPLLAAMRSFPYFYGGRYAYNVYEAGGARALADLPSYVPATTLQVMLSERSVADVDLPDPFTGAVAPPEGNTYVSEDVLGAWMLSQLVETQELGGVYSGDILDWGRDHVAIYLSAEDEVTVVWRLGFTSANAASAFASSFSGAIFYPEGSEHTVLADQDAVTLVVTDDAERLDAWTYAIRSGVTLTLEPTPAEAASGTAARPSRMVDLLRRRRPDQGRFAPMPPNRRLWGESGSR